MLYHRKVLSKFSRVSGEIYGHVFWLKCVNLIVQNVAEVRRLNLTKQDPKIENSVKDVRFLLFIIYNGKSAIIS